MEMALIDPGREQGIALQGNRLALVTTRYPHVTDQHVRQTSNQVLPHSLTFRQGLSRKKWPYCVASLPRDHGERKSCVSRHLQNALSVY
jgi:hypothetical protein